MSRYRWLSALVVLAGCNGPPEAPFGLQLAFSSDALAATSALVIRTYEIGKLLDAAKPCTQGLVLSSVSGSLIGATVTCTAIEATGVHGTLRDEAGVIAIDGDTPAALTFRRVSGGRRVFESEGDLAGFRGDGGLLSWRWWVPAEALRSVPGLAESKHPAMLLLDGRTSGVLYPGQVPALVLFLGLRSALSDESLQKIAAALAERLGAAVEKRVIAGRTAFCIDGQGLLDEFAPCAVSLPDLAGVAVGFNEPALTSAIADFGPVGPPAFKADFKLMTDIDNQIAGSVAWPFSSLAVTSSANAALLTVVP